MSTRPTLPPRLTIRPPVPAKFFATTNSPTQVREILTDNYELLRTSIHNDCSIVPFCGSDDDARATYLAALFQQT